MIQRSDPDQPLDRNAPQLAYSDLQDAMLDEAGRRKKAAKIVNVLTHFIGKDDLQGLTALDIGCSTGYVCDALDAAGARVTGIDIDEPGLARAKARSGDRIEFRSASGAAIPLDSNSVDVVVFNHIYEHVPDADAVMAEIRRVLRPDGVVYLGLGNKLGIMEPHYKLPFLSWLPKSAADRYIKRTGRAQSYYETFRTRPALKKMCHGLNVWEYTYAVLSEPALFGSDDMVPRRLSNASPTFWKALTPIIPTFIWVGTPGQRAPSGRPVRAEPKRVVSRG